MLRFFKRGRQPLKLQECFQGLTKDFRLNKNVWKIHFLLAVGLIQTILFQEKPCPCKFLDNSEGKEGLTCDIKFSLGKEDF